MATPPAQPTETSAAASTTVDSLKDDTIQEILLQLPSPASLARAALSSRRWRRVASSPDFLRRFRERHPSPPVLGLFVSQTDLGQLPVFHPSASVRADPDLAAAARGGDFLLTRLEHDPRWRLRDCRDGRLLLCRGESLSVYNPISHRHDTIRRPPPTEPLPLSSTEYIADCLLGAGHGEDNSASFRVVSVQRDGTRLRAMEYRSGTPHWRCHPWVDDIGVATLCMPAMPAAAAGLIFWRRDQNSSLLLDTSTMAFSMVPLPASLLSTQAIRPWPVYGIGDTEAGECCLVFIVGRNTLQVWLLKKNGTGNTSWELERQSQISELPGFTRRLGFYMVAAGQAIVYCMGTKYSHFVIDLKNLSLKDKFLCHRSMAYPFQLTWPPAGLVAASTCETSMLQTYACKDVEKQQEASSSSRKRKSKEEMSCGKETMEPCISTASFNDESSEKKVCFNVFL